MATIRIGTAGWSIPRQYSDKFPREGTSLERYSTVFPGAEINSTFYRAHRTATWERWRDSVPAAFRFSVKLPKEITHTRKLIDVAEPLDDFVDQVALLGDELAVLLVQLPPKLIFDPDIARRFFTDLRGRSAADIACEPRNPSWFTPEADALLDQLGIARVAADPAIAPEAALPGGCRALSYWRLHGSPHMYRSSYADRVNAYAEKLNREARAGRQVWCIFDNTASSAATADALALLKAISS